MYILTESEALSQDTGGHLSFIINYQWSFQILGFILHNLQDKLLDITLKKLLQMALLNIIILEAL